MGISYTNLRIFDLRTETCGFAIAERETCGFAIADRAQAFVDYVAIADFKEKVCLPTSKEDGIYMDDFGPPQVFAVNLSSCQGSN